MKKSLYSADKFRELAEKFGLHDDPLFDSTLERYETQLKILEDLKKEINEGDVTVTKEYVKGRQNIYINPAVREFNNTANAANKTVSTLLSILKAAGNDADDDEPGDPLLDALNGVSDD